MKYVQKNLFGGILALHVFRENRYRKVTSSGMPKLVAHPSILRTFMKGKFDFYVLLPLAKSFQNWIIDQSTDQDFTVIDLKLHKWLL